MSFVGPDPYGTAGGTDDINKPQFPADIRTAETRTLIIFLRVNGPVALKSRENLEDVIRILNLDFPGLTIRSFNTIFDKSAIDIDMREGITVVSTGVGSIDLKIDTNDIETFMFLNESVTLAKLAAGSVDSSKIVDGSIVNADISATAAIAGSKLAAGGVGTTQLADGGVTTIKILDGTVALADLGTDSVDSSKIVDDSIVNADISATAAIAGTKLAAGGVGTTQLADGGVTTAKILDGTVALGDLAADSVDSSKIVDNSIVNADISATAAIDCTKTTAACVGHGSNPGIQIVSSSTTTSVEREVACPGGTIVTSCGCEAPGGGADFIVFQTLSEFSSNCGTGVVNGCCCRWSNTGATGTVYAVCVDTTS